MKIYNKKISLAQLMCLIVYYAFAIFLPDSNGFIKWGTKFRGYLCRRIFHRAGKGIMIHRGARFGSGLDIEIGDNSDIGVNAVIPSDTKIGNNVLMAPNCYIFSVNHEFKDTSIPIKQQGVTQKKQTIIEDDVWIGQNVTMTPGHTIRKGSIIGTCCVLTKDFPAYSIVGGNPSKLIRNRK